MRAATRRAEYRAAHIPGARFVDIDDVSDARSDLPHMAPTTEKFISRMRALGIGDGHQVVVYDGAGLFSAARMWWLFRLMGKTDVAVLDGGFPKWQAEDRPVEDVPPVVRDRHMTVSRQNHLVRDVTQVARDVKLGTRQVGRRTLPARFRGEEPEPRPGLRAGHIPGSRNVHYRDLAERRRHDEGRRRPPRRFRGGGRRPVAAGRDDLRLRRYGGDPVAGAGAPRACDHALYDGSWSEWGMYGDLAVATGP